jgi:hypothetical protein
MKERVLPTKAVLKTIMKILSQKTGPIIVIKKNFQDAETLGAIYFLENKGLIYNLRHIKGKEDKYDKGDVIFAMSSREALYNYYLERYEDSVKDPYGSKRQVEIVKEVILAKAEKLDNNTFTLGASDFKEGQRKHIYLIPSIETLSGGKFLEIKKIDLPPFGDLEYKIKLLKRQKKTDKTEEPKSKKANQFKKPKFRFSNGVLFRDFCDETLAIKNENTQEFKLLRLALSLPMGERIDAMTDELDMSFRQIYDTATRLNEKIKNIFGIDAFFLIDSKNKHITRAVE